MAFISIAGSLSHVTAKPTENFVFYDKEKYYLLSNNVKKNFLLQLLMCIVEKNNYSLLDILCQSNLNKVRNELIVEFPSILQELKKLQLFSTYAFYRR